MLEISEKTLKDGPFFEQPIFVLGLPRSGTSMIAGALGLCGAWMGQTVKGGGRENPKGFFEHQALREEINKTYLRSMRCDSLGVQRLPDIDALRPLPQLRELVATIISREGYNGKRPWLFKDAKLSLVWPIWQEAFPQARWVIVRRASEEIVKSCLKTRFMVQHSSHAAFWYKLIDSYLDRLALLKESGVWWREVWAGPIVEGDLAALQQLVDDLGLQWNKSTVVQFIEPLFWHSEKRNSDSPSGTHSDDVSTTKIRRDGRRGDKGRATGATAESISNLDSEQTTVDPSTRAQGLLRQGHLKDALAIYREICADRPKDALSWMMQGIIHGQMGDLNQAEHCCLTAVTLAPDSPKTHYNLAKVYELQGNIEKAIASYEAACSLQPNAIQALSNLGMLLNKAGRYNEAEAKYRNALCIASDDISANSNLASLLLEQGRTTEAENIYRKLIEIHPKYADAYYNLAHLLITQDRSQEALTQIDRAIAVKRIFPQAWYNRGLLLQGNKRYQEAADSYLEAIRQSPDFIDAYINLSNVLCEQEKYSEALRYARTAAEIGTGSAEAYNNLGVLLRLQDRDDEAEACYRKALQIQPDYADAHSNLGNLLRLQGLISEAEASLRMALKFDSEHANAHWNLSLALLARGVFAEGWKEYEWGLRADGTRDVTTVELPAWDGQVHVGQRILMLAEQGIGDEVMFASCIPDIVASGLLCVLESDARLVPLFSRSFSQVKVIFRKTAEESAENFLKRAGSIDSWIAEGSLPRYFRSDFMDYPQRRSYLSADSRQIEEWKKRYEQLGSGIKVGISWRGGANQEQRQLRSIDLLYWSDLLRIPKVVFIDIQYGDTHVERAALQSQTRLTLHHFDEVDPLHDLDRFAAQLVALDLVISIDNSTVHLAGALGVPTWVLLPKVADWRWFQDRDDSPWYPSVRLIRQKRRADWTDALKEAIEMLHGCLERDGMI